MARSTTQQLWSLTFHSPRHVVLRFDNPRHYWRNIVQIGTHTPAYCGEAHPVSLQHCSSPLTISASCIVKNLVHDYLKSFSTQLCCVAYWWDSVESTQKSVDGRWPRAWRLPEGGFRG